MKTDKYFRITQFVDKPIEKGMLLASSHIVKAENKDKALHIFNKHQIQPIPKGINIVRQNVKDLGEISNWILKRRWKGIGGSVWYEDENGDLQKEIKQQ